MRFISSLLFLIITFNSYAEEVFPADCAPFVVENELISLPAASPRMIMIHNLAAVDLWITHPVSDPGASAGWSSRLQSGNWSALMMNDTSFELSCIESRPGHEQQVSCKNVVGICEWAVTPSKKTNGIFWAAENMQLDPLVAYIGRQGFKVPTAKIK